MNLEIKVPDIGDFKNVEIIEVLIKEGDQIKKNDPILTLESDKSSVEVPSPFDGKISSVKVKVGDKVSKGSLIATLSGEGSSKVADNENLYFRKQKRSFKKLRKF
jgi:pyruvate/2-oxoglutarate dehydrogenase complex dihydrolipoamide acyltransferase (E2) component